MMGDTLSLDAMLTKNQKRIIVDYTAIIVISANREHSVVPKVTAKNSETEIRF
jgi:hypothetical protein